LPLHPIENQLFYKFDITVKKIFGKEILETEQALFVELELSWNYMDEHSCYYRRIS
jgi:hypothetical protein